MSGTRRGGAAGAAGAAAAAALALALAVAGCSGSGSDSSPSGHTPSPSASASGSAGGSAAPSAAELAGARSTTQEDSVYPEVGDPGVDALHYALDLRWDTGTRTLTGHEELRFRATADADHVQLDLGTALTAHTVLLDGTPVRAEHRGKDLVVPGEVRRDSEHTLVLDYSGTPTPVRMPSTRRDTPTLGLTVDEDGGLWTMQEPYGAFTWYAVNDQPSDKALYDISVDAPAPMIGIANGELTDRHDEDGRTHTRWHLDSPAASYLVTLAVGRYTRTTDPGPDGLEISYWTAPGATTTLTALRRAPQLLAWLEKRLGPYPFDSLGFVVVAGDSGMETQTMITLGDDPSDTDPEVLVHELAHQWYGDLVTPSDWRDVWMNEGMATYLQGAWQDDTWQLPPGDSLSDWVAPEKRSRKEAGPPGAYRRDRFAELNVYYGPALMWERLRTTVGDAVFWKLVRDWPAARAERSTGRQDYEQWIEQQTGRDLTAFFRQWLLSPTTPG